LVNVETVREDLEEPVVFGAAFVESGRMETEVVFGS
jgi:hypothetical protein